jgi:hypothetical protein
MTEPLLPLTRAMAQLADLLRAERVHLLSGAARAAAELYAPKLAALSALEQSLAAATGAERCGAATGLADIASRARENGAHLMAAGHGLRCAIQRLEAPTAAHEVGAYRANGQRTAFGLAAGGYAKKA